MEEKETRGGAILTIFDVRARSGSAEELLTKFATTSAEVGQDEPGNKGYYFGKGIAQDKDHVVFVSVWEDLNTVKSRFGDD